MQGKQQFCNLISRIIWRAATAALAIATVFVLTVVLTPSAQAQTFTVIHSLSGGGDGAYPGGLTIDQAGNLYISVWGYRENPGVVLRLSKKGSGWLASPLYTFTGSNDGSNPQAPVVFGPDGNLYGTTTYGGVAGCQYIEGCGTVFQLKPAASACKTALCPWQETLLHRFTGGSDGGNPDLGALIFDQAGNLYGTGAWGGAYGDGVVFEFTPSQGGWTESVLHSFSGPDGAFPSAGLTFDENGNLYSTTAGGGLSEYGCGTVFQLTPSGSGWTENVLYSFQCGNDGQTPYAGVIFDASGDLYGATALDGEGGGGTVFELTPSGGSWIFSLVYGLTGGRNDQGPMANLVMDGAGNLYGTTRYNGAYSCGSVFKLTPSNSGWTYTSLHDFCAGGYPCRDGEYPMSSVTFDANGNLYGTATMGGANGLGVVWEITP